MVPITDRLAFQLTRSRVRCSAVPSDPIFPQSHPAVTFPTCGALLCLKQEKAEGIARVSWPLSDNNRLVEKAAWSRMTRTGSSPNFNRNRNMISLLGT